MVDKKYLKSALVRFFYDSKGEAVAGYVVNKTAPLRCFKAIPGGDIVQSFKNCQIEENECCELTCLWIDSKKISLLSIVQVYWHSIYDARNTGKSYIFGGTGVQKIMERQMQGFPYLFYHGPLVHISDNIKVGWVYYAVSKEIWLRFVQLALCGFVFRSFKRFHLRLREFFGGKGAWISNSSK